MTAEDVFTSAQAAAHLHVSDKTMRRMREAGRGPTYHREASGRVVYTRAALEAWRKSQYVVTIIYAPLLRPAAHAA